MTTTLAVFDVVGSLPRFGGASVSVIAPDAATALRDAAALDFILAEAARVTVERQGDAYCDHGDAGGMIGGTWECDWCRETWQDGHEPYRSASDRAFRVYCEALQRY